MQWRIGVIVSAWLALCAPAAVRAQQTAPMPATPAPSVPPTDWQAANREVVGLVQAGRYAEAEARAKAARALCPADPGLLVLCQTLLQENTAWAWARSGRFAEAEAAYKEALAARELAFPVNDLAIGDSAAALGFFYAERQRWDDAAAQLERVVEIFGGGGADRTPVLATAYARLADAYRAQGRMNAALTTAREAADAMTKRAGADAPVTQNARANLAALLRDAGQGAEAMDLALAALRPETLPLEQRVRLTIEAVATANALGRTDAVRAAFETTLSLVAHWADVGDSNQRQGFVQLALAGGEMALNRGDPDAALDLARRAKAVIVEVAGKLDARASGALILEARALLDQGQAEQAASLLTEANAQDPVTKPPAGQDPAAKPPMGQLAWTVRALMDAGRMDEARARLSALQSDIAGRPEEQSSFGASLLQLAAQLAERRGDPRAALAAIEQAVGYLPAPGIGTPNAIQSVNLRRDAIRLRAVLGDTAGTAAALSALLDAQIKGRLPLQSLLETRLLSGWFAAEMRQTDMVRAQITAVEQALPALEAQAPRGAAMMLTRLAELSLALPGGAGAAGAMGYLERARLTYERTGQSPRDAARAAILRGRILGRLDRGMEALAECREAVETLSVLLPGAEAAWRDAMACEVRAELQLGQYARAGRSVARLLERLPVERKIERAEVSRLLAEAQSGQDETDAADQTLRAALELVADVSPRRAGLRAEIWGAISANLHRGGRDREARNAAVAQRQIGNEDNAGAALSMQSLRHEATALLTLQQLEEAITVLDRAERLRGALLRADPALLQEHDAVLARVELARGRYAEAGTVADRVIAGYRAVSGSSGAAPPRAGLATILEIRASVHLAQGAFVAAETAQREALDLRAAHSGGQAGIPSAAPADTALARLGLARIIDQRGNAPLAGRERDAGLAALAAARGEGHASVKLAWLDAVPSLLRQGKVAEAAGVIDACEAALKDGEGARAVPCQLARAAMAARAGAWPDARIAATTALAALRARGDADRPALVAPLLVLAEAAEAVDDDVAMQAALAQVAPLLVRAALDERLRGMALQARRLLWDGRHAEAETAGQDGLALVTANLPVSFAPALLGLTDTTAKALLAQGRGALAAGLWRAALKRLDGWGGTPALRGTALQGLGAALQETPDLAGALKAWQDAAAMRTENDLADQAAMAGVVRAALAAGRFDVARAQAAKLTASASPGAALLSATLRAEIAEEGGDPVSAMLEWWRAASLAGEVPADAAAASVTMARAARAALAAGQKPRAESLVAQVRAADQAAQVRAADQAAQVRAADQAAQVRAARGEAVAGSDVALALLEMEALLRVEDADVAAAQLAVEAWRVAVQRRFGAAGRAALAPELMQAALDQRVGDYAEAASRLALALGRAEALRGRSSLLWARIAVQAAAAAEKLGDGARAAALRQQAKAVLDPTPTPTPTR